MPTTARLSWPWRHSRKAINGACTGKVSSGQRVEYARKICQTRLLQLQRLGWKTIAQDESTSVVWGMPRAAVTLGAADQILPLPLIGQAIASHLSIQNPSQAQARSTSF